VPAAREWLGSLLLRSPVRLGSLRNVPVLGSILHRLSHRVLPGDQLVWGRILSGPGAGLWLEVHPRTGAELLSGELERESQAVVAKHLRPGMIFYDLGANIGRFSLIGARIVGPQGKVFAFEPDSDLVARLRRNADRNHLSNITGVAAGVWSTSTTLEFRPAGAGSPEGGTGSFLPGQSPGALTSVRCISLDDFVSEAPAPQGIKCDVEGAEMEVLRGAESTLRRHRPWILCEIHAAENGPAARNFLENLGYTCAAVDDNHIFAASQKDS